MDLFWKSLGGLIVAVVLGLALGKDMSLLLSLAVCTMGAAVTIRYLEPVLSVLKNMQQMANLQTGILETLIKIMGICILSEIAGMIFADAGSGAMGKLLKFMTSSVIVWISIPVLDSLLTLLQQILGEA